MVCILCGDKTQVINSRPQRRTNQVWRRRECLSCKTVFTTNETADYTATWVIRGAQGSIQPFVRDKLFMSVYKSLQHRHSPLEDAGAVTDTIMQKLVQLQPGAAIERQTIIQLTQVALHRFDTAASVYYAAFHKV